MVVAIHSKYSQGIWVALFNIESVDVYLTIKYNLKIRVEGVVL